MVHVSLKHAILGFLELEPTTGYTLQQRFEGSLRSFWTATQSQIYRELHALEAAKQVDLEVQPQQGKPPRKVYTLTAAGKAELRRWLEQPVEPPQLRDPLLLKFVFAADVSPEIIDRMLADYVAGLEATRGEYQARLKSREIFMLARSERERVLWELSIENGLAWCEAQIGWGKRARRRLAKAKSSRRNKE